MKKVFIGLIVFLVAVIAAIFLFPTSRPSSENGNEPAPAQDSLRVRRKLDGVMVPPDKSDLKTLGVMIENHPDARPQSGLSAAKLVWEAPVEGGITRFFAVYDGTEKTEEIGPVRSARPYYLDWAKELDAVYAHVGGSPEALSLLPSYKLIDLNQFFSDKYFWRSAKRLAPHNVYTSSVLLSKFASALKQDKQTSKYDTWLYKDEPASTPKDVKDLVVEYSTDQFEVRWKYDGTKNEYLRYLDGARHVDKDGSLIKAKNIVVQFAKVLILDEEGRRKVTTIDSGRALVIQDGQVIDGTWKKIDKASRTRFFDDKGNEIKFNAGPTWIEVVPKGTDVQY